MKIHLRVVAGPDLGRQFTFETRDRFVIGRAPAANFQIQDDLYFSRHHLMLEVNPPNVLLQDLKSTNGTLVNDVKVQAPVQLRHGDTISGGKTRIQLAFEDDPAEVPRTPAPPATPGRKPSLLDVARSPRSLSPDDKVAVRCLRCGATAANELPRARAEQMTYFCDACQGALLEEPKLLPGYQVIRELGRGGMGAVYLAVHERLQQRRAIKMILPRAAMSQKVRDLFLREASAQAMLDHPRVVRVHDLQEATKGIFCMVMEYVEGSNAQDLVEQSARGLEPRLAGHIIAQALEGLGHAHAHGLVHRDIKDANLLVGTGGAGELSVKLSDFGLAKSYETSGASGFTRTGDIGGTIYYMAPEQILDFRNVKPTADLYAMGATLYHLLTKAPVYNFRPQMDPLVTILEEDVVPIAQRNPNVPPAIAAVAEHALRREPAQRFRSADEMRHALLAAIA